MRRLAAALILVTACGEAEPAVAPAPAPLRVIEPGGPPSVPVLQVAPGSISAHGWLTDTLAYAVDGPRLHVWDPATGRVVFAAPLPGLPAEHDPSRVRRIGDRVIVAGSELVLARGEVVAAGYDLLSPEPTTYASIARDHELPLDQLEIVLHRGGAEAPARVTLPRDAQVSYSRDARTLMVCADDAVRFYDAGSGAERAALDLEEVTDCAWPEGEGPIVVVADRTLHLLDPTSLAPGAPLPDVAHAHVSPDGRRLAMATTGSREGVTVIELGAGRELLHLSRSSPDAVRVVGDLVALHESDLSTTTGPMGEVRRIDGTPEGAVLASGAGVLPDHVGPLGVLVVEDGTLTLRNTVGETVARYEHPRAATLRVEDGTVHAHTSAAWYRLDEEGSRRFGPCPEERSDHGAVPPAAVRVGTRYYLVRRGCAAADDGSSTDGGPLRATEDGRVSLWVDGGRLVLHEGDARRPLALDEGEAQPCSQARCPIPVAFSPDGAWLAVVRGPRLRVFDTSTGEVTHRASVAVYTRALAFLSSGALMQQDHEGALRLFAPPGRGPLRERLHRPHERGRSAVVARDWLLDTHDEGLEVLDASGRSLGAVTAARHTDVMVSGSRVWMGGLEEVRLLELPRLEEVGRVSGRLVAVVGPDAFLCRPGDVLVRVREEGGRLSETESPQLCPRAVVPHRAGWLVGDELDGASLVRADGRVLQLFAIEHGDRIALAGLDGDRAVGPVRWMRRSPGLTAEGMIEAEPALASIEAWLAEAP